MYCNTCGEYLGKDIYPQGGHGHTTRHTTVEPTCETQGEWEETCDLCGTTVAHNTIAPTGNTDNGDGYCSCGYEFYDHANPKPADPGVPELPDWAKDPEPETTSQDAVSDVTEQSSTDPATATE